MTAFALVDATVYVHGYDFTGDSNQISLTAEADDLDTTTFGSQGWRARIAGLKNTELNLSGFWGSSPDAEAFGDLGVMDRVHTVSPDRVEGNPAYLFRAGKFTYSQFGEVGEAAPFDLGSMGSDNQGLIRGALLKAKGSVNATGATGIADLVLPAVGAAEYLYGAFHVIGTPGTTITAVIESDDNAGFSSATTRITFGPITTAGGTWATRVAGAITDTHYRLRVTAITGTFTVAAAVGIGT